MLSQILLSIWLSDHIFLILRIASTCFLINLAKCVHCKDNKLIFKEDNMFYNYQIQSYFFQLNEPIHHLPNMYSLLTSRDLSLLTPHLRMIRLIKPRIELTQEVRSGKKEIIARGKNCLNFSSKDAHILRFITDGPFIFLKWLCQPE